MRGIIGEHLAGCSGVYERKMRSHRARSQDGWLLLLFSLYHLGSSRLVPSRAFTQQFQDVCICCMTLGAHVHLQKFIPVPTTYGALPLLSLLKLGGRTTKPR